MIHILPDIERTGVPPTQTFADENSDDVLINLTLDGRISSWNAAAARLFRLDGGASSEASLRRLRLKLEQATGDLSTLLSQAIPLDSSRPFLAHVDEKDVILSISPIFGRDGRATGACVIARRPALQKHQALLVRELHHRARNTFTVVQSLARQIFKDSADPASPCAQFLGRLEALASSHRQLSRGHWSGLRLRDVGVEQVTPFVSGDPARCTFRGPELQLKEKAAVNVAMTFHELATNSAKYGAFSVPEGRVEVSWIAEGHGAAERFRLCWREFGGPRVIRPPRRGLGSRLLEQALPGELAARAELCFHKTGVWYSLDAPLASVAA
jgi:two-component sensor histidine kinase